MVMCSVQFIRCCIIALHVLLTSADDHVSCPTWFFYSNTTQECVCGYESTFIHCDQQAMKVLLKIGCCVTYSGHDGIYYGGECPLWYRANSTHTLFTELPSDPELLEEAVCGTYNRKGFQCSRCIDGYGPGVYSLDRTCAECSNLSTASAICLYFVVAFVPITLFFIFVVVSHLNIMSGPLLGYVLFSQGFSVAIEHYLTTYFFMESNLLPPLRPVMKMFLVLFETWNMRFLRPFIKPFCVNPNLRDIDVVIFGLLPNIHLVFLVILSFSVMELHARNRTVRALWKPFKLALKKTNTISVSSEAVIQAFATFTLLSSTINMFTVYSLIEKISVRSSNTKRLYKTVLYFDASIEFFSPTHIYFLLIASLQCVLLILLPSLVLLVYPTRIYRYVSRFISTRKQLAIMTFVEALNNCFNDGLNGTRDYRLLSGFLLLCFPMSVMLCWVLQITIASGYNDELCVFFTFSLLSLLLSYVRPFKSVVTNMSFSFYLILYAVCSLTHSRWVKIKTAPQAVENVFFLIALSAQIPVVVWGSYHILLYMMRKCSSRRRQR